MKSGRNNAVKRLLLLVVVILCVSLSSGEVFADQKTLKAPDNLVVKQSGKTSLTLSWSRVKSAKGYEIYKIGPCLSGYSKIKTTKKTKWKDKSVGIKRTGTYKVRAYKKYKGKKIYSNFSYTVSAKTCGKNDKVRNAAKPELIYSGQEDALILGINEPLNEELDEMFYVTVKGQKRKGGKSSRAINKKVRWFSTDTDIVKAKSKRNIKAGTKTGKCSVYIRTHNGLKSKKVPVIVKDFAYEKFDIKYAPGYIQEMFSKSEKDIRDICSYYSKNRVKEEFGIRLFAGEDWYMRGKVPNDPMVPRIKKVLEATPYSNVEVRVLPGRVFFTVTTVAGMQMLIFRFDREASKLKELTDYWLYKHNIYDAPIAPLP